MRRSYAVLCRRGLTSVWLFLASVWLFLASVCMAAGCASDDPAVGDPAQPDSSMPSERDGGDDGGDGDAGDERAECDLTGAWIVQHHTLNVALGADQLATNWSYHRFERDAAHGPHAFRIVDGLDCGYVVRGSTDVSLSDDTLEAMALHAARAEGTRATFTPTADGNGCELSMDRIYSIRGADRARFLDDVWQVGDDPKPLSDFELPTDEASGMEDWDDDGHEAITQLTGLGDRYTAQLDWHALSGEVAVSDVLSGVFGGEDVIIADYDALEAVSAETPPLLSTVASPMPPGYGYFVRADEGNDALDLEPSGARPELAICKQVQALAVEKLGDPPQP